LLSNSQNKVSKYRVMYVKRKIETEIVHNTTSIHITLDGDGVIITKSKLGTFIEGNITLLWDEFDKVVNVISKYRGEVEHVDS